MKQKVKEKEIEKEHQEWIATLEVSIKTGWGWWQIARWDSKLLKDIKFILNLLSEMWA